MFFDSWYIGTLKDENKTIDKLIKQRGDEFLILTEELQQAKAKVLTYFLLVTFT